MEELRDALLGTALFEGVPQDKIICVLKCLNAEEIHVTKSSHIVHQDKTVAKTLYLIQGRFQIIKDDYYGYTSILDECTKGSVIGAETFFNIILLQKYDLIAAEDCTFVALNSNQLIEAKPCCQKYINIVKANLAKISIDMNNNLLHKLDILSNRSIRSKILAYLDAQSKKAQSNTFRIPHSRQELADLLYIDRSALSHELSKMQSEGIIDYSRSEFTLYIHQ